MTGRLVLLGNELTRRCCTLFASRVIPLQVAVFAWLRDGEGRTRRCRFHLRGYRLKMCYSHGLVPPVAFSLLLAILGITRDFSRHK